MTEIKDRETSQQPGLSRPRKLELKKTVETGQVRQSFSHGRSKMVTVEVRKKRTFAPDSGGRMSEVKAAQQAGAHAAAEAALDQTDEVQRDGSVRSLTTEEKAARARALQDAIRAEEERIVEAVPDESQPAVEVDAPEAAEPVDEPQVSVEETAAVEPETPAPADDSPAAPEEAATAAAAKAEPAKAPASPGKARGPVAEEDAEGRQRAKKAGRPDVRRLAATTLKRGEPRRRAGKLTIAEALEDGAERTRSLAAVRRAREREKQKQRERSSGEGVKVIREVVVPEMITVGELANRMAERGADVVKALMKMGVMATITQSIDADTAEVVVNEFGHNIKRVSDADVEIGLKGDVDDADALASRPPVVTVMGHVDHGKTSLLDALRKTDVAAHEAGGITQHIGAYQVTVADGAKITFIDTPGHAAFTAMRARGANVTDIVVLVVAADDGIMPQTVEAIRHAKAAGVPLIVAINKIDRPDSDTQRVRNELLQHEVLVEEVGGETLCVEVSAKEGTNLDRLVEAILLQAELMDLSANPERPGEGVVVEAKMERGRGTVATILVQRGTLRMGDIFIAGGEWGRVRGLYDASGGDIEFAVPGMPVEVLGLNGAPAAGDDVVVVDNEARAREISDFRQRKLRDAKAAATTRGTLEQMMARIQEGETKELAAVVKADVHGSVEAIVGAVEKLGTDEVKINVLHAAVGGINESDVTLARASNAIVIGFNVRANPQARELAKRDDVEIRYYSIIYDLTDDMKTILTGMLAPTLRESILGYAQIRQVFAISKVGKVAGCMVTEGVIRRGCRVRLLRDDVVIHLGDLSQLKRFKDDVREVKEGYDCGVALEHYQDIQEGDVIECFEVEEVAREL